MTTTDLTAEAELDAVLGWLDDDEQFHQEHAARARRNKSAVEHTANLLRQYRMETAPISGDGEGLTHFGVSASDIANCPTILEALGVIACKSNGYLHYRTAGRLVQEAGLSRSKNLNNLASDLLYQLKRNKDWERHSPGVFKYLPYTRKSEGKNPPKPGKTVDIIPVSTAHIRPSPRFGGGRNGEAGPS